MKGTRRLATPRLGPVVCALLLWLAGRVEATVVAPAEWSELVLAARAIVHGRIVEVRSQTTPGRRRVETIVTLRVEAYFKGDLGPTVSFRVPGGQVGRYRTVVVGAPGFTAGEQVVLLLGTRGPSIPYVLGLSQGVFRVSGDPVSGEPRVTPAPLVATGAGVQRVVRGDPAHAPMSLGDLRRLVDEALGARP